MIPVENLLTRRNVFFFANLFLLLLTLLQQRQQQQQQRFTSLDRTDSWVRSLIDLYVNDFNLSRITEETFTSSGSCVVESNKNNFCECAALSTASTRFSSIVLKEHASKRMQMATAVRHACYLASDYKDFDELRQIICSSAMPQCDPNNNRVVKHCRSDCRRIAEKLFNKSFTKLNTLFNETFTKTFRANPLALAAVPLLFRLICVDNVLACDSALFSDDNTTCSLPRAFNVGHNSVKERNRVNVELRRCLLEREQNNPDAACKNSTKQWFVQPNRFGCDGNGDVAARLETSEALAEFMTSNAMLQHSLPLTVRYTNKKFNVRFGVGIVAVAEALMIEDSFVQNETLKQSAIGVAWTFRCDKRQPVQFVEAYANLLDQSGISRSSLMVNFSLSENVTTVMVGNHTIDSFVKQYNVSAHALKIAFTSDSFVYGNARSNRVVVQFRMFFEPFNAFAYGIENEQTFDRSLAARVFALPFMNSDFKMSIGSPQYAVYDERVKGLTSAFADFHDAQLIYHTLACPALTFEYQFERFNRRLVFDPDFQVLYDQGLIYDDDENAVRKQQSANQNTSTVAIVVIVILLIIILIGGITVFVMRDRLRKLYQSRAGTE